MKSLFERMGGTYTVEENGICYPDLTVSEDEKPCYGKYGMLRKQYLRDHRKGRYLSLLMTGRLNGHLNHVDHSANMEMELLTKRMQKVFHLDEVLKEKDQLAWVAAMNNINRMVEEIVLKEFVYN